MRRVAMGHHSPNLIPKEGSGAQPAPGAASETPDPVGNVVVDSSSLRDSPCCFWRWWQVGPGPTCHHLHSLRSACGAEESTTTFPTGSHQIPLANPSSRILGACGASQAVGRGGRLGRAQPAASTNQDESRSDEESKKGFANGIQFF